MVFFIFLTIFLWSLTLVSSQEQVHVTQSPSEKTLQLGQSVTITCKSSLDVGKWCSSKFCLSWYLKKSGEALKLLIFGGNVRSSSIPSRFSGSGSDKLFQLIISEVQAEDTGDYYCLGDLGDHRFTQ